jgi:hypothetical protein
VIGAQVTVEQEVNEILNPGIDAIKEGSHPDIGDAMNMLGRAVAAIEYLARKLDEAAKV